MSEKVYCRDCKYLNEILHPTESLVIRRECRAVVSGQNTYLEVELEYGDPQIENTKNNCKQYEPKWWKRWVK